MQSPGEMKNPLEAERREDSDPTLFSTDLLPLSVFSVCNAFDTHFETRASACLSLCSKVLSLLALFL